MTEHRIAGLAVTVEGSGPALLFLHGIGSSRHGFAAQIGHFKSRYTCIAPDAPGYGDSDDVERIDGMDGYAAAFEALLDPFGPAAIVGVSFGGVVAARITMRGRTPIRALVLADTSRGSGVDPVKAQAMRLRADELERVGAHAFAAARARRLVSDDAPGDLVDRVGAAMASTIRLPGYAQAADAMAGTDHSERLGEINCPTLVVVGEHDAVCPPTEAELIATAIPGASLTTITEAGHLSYQERPTRFNDAIDRFLDRHHLNPAIPSTNRIGARP